MKVWIDQSETEGKSLDGLRLFLSSFIVALKAFNIDMILAQQDVASLYMFYVLVMFETQKKKIM